MASSGNIEIEKFNGHSFESWKLKMEDLLVNRDQWIVVDLGTKPMGVSDEEWKKLDWKAKSTIRLCVSDSLLLNVSGEATAKALWDKNLIFVSKLDDASVKGVFEKDSYKMVHGELLLMQGVRIGTLYKLQGSTVIDGCNSSVVPESGVENLVVSREKAMLWHQRLGHIREKGLRILHGKGMVEV
eukprot:PITA_31846